MEVDDDAAAYPVNAVSPVPMASTVLADAVPSAWRRASQPMSLYVSHTTPDSSSQASALTGRSMPLVCFSCMSNVPALGLPKITSSVGRNERPTAEAFALIDPREDRQSLRRDLRDEAFDRLSHRECAAHRNEPIVIHRCLLVATRANRIASQDGTRVIAAHKRPNSDARAGRRTFNDLARAANVTDLVTRSISGHLTEQMQRHYSTVNGTEQRTALAKVIELANRPTNKSGEVGGEAARKVGRIRRPRDEFFCLIL